MLDSLQIKNFKNLEDLQIKRLSRVNLITGKNNTGKSTLLEALAIYASKGDMETIFKILYGRDEAANKNIQSSQKSITNLISILSLFSNRNTENNQLSIGNISGYEEINGVRKNITLTLEIVDDSQQHAANIEDYIPRIVSEDLSNYAHSSYGLVLSCGSSSFHFPMDILRPTSIGLNKMIEIDKFQFVKTQEVSHNYNAILWDSISLTDKESILISALQIIDSKIIAINFRAANEEQKHRIPFVRLIDNEIVPLRSMGDGVNRILTIILAMVNCENGYLLIDEFENGLHYSVQQKLWEVIFKLAEELNIQVFATTHSSDTIASFEAVLNEDNRKDLGMLFRLDYKKGKIVAVDYDAEVLGVAVEQDIEVR